MVTPSFWQIPTCIGPWNQGSGTDSSISHNTITSVMTSQATSITCDITPAPRALITLVASGKRIRVVRGRMWQKRRGRGPRGIKRGSCMPWYTQGGRKARRGTGKGRYVFTKSLINLGDRFNNFIVVSVSQ